MPKTIVTIATWSCDCGYKQDFNPSNKELMSLHFPGLPIGKCPACVQGQNSKRKKDDKDLKKEENIDNKIRIVIKGEEDIDSSKSTEEKTKEKNKIKDDIKKWEEASEDVIQ